jgi:SAM-dependent methyltransferase
MSRIVRASHGSTNDAVFSLISLELGAGKRVIDLGAGRGHMASRLAEHAVAKGLDPCECLMACDLFSEHYQCEAVPFQQYNLNEPLPFDDCSFDALYSIEVFEHVHRPYDLISECARLLKPDGLLVFTVPNTLHMVSRVNFLLTGFFTLYVPPSTDPARAGRISGHVMPLSYPYFAYGLRRAGFRKVTFTYDRLKRGARILAALLYPFLRVGTALYHRSIRAYDPEVHAENDKIISMVNSPQMLAARSCIMVARK